MADETIERSCYTSISDTSRSGWSWNYDMPRSFLSFLFCVCALAWSHARADSIASAIYKVVPQSRDTFILGNGEQFTPFLAFDLTHEPVTLQCESTRQYNIYAYSTEQGAIGVAICTKGAPRLRRLIEEARSHNKAHPQPSGRQATSFEDVRFEIETERTDANSTYYYIPAFLAGHGLVPVPTGILVRPTGAVIVQLSSHPLCTGSARPPHVLCADKKRRLQEIAMNVVESGLR
ncbi:hypothetical protein LZ009_14190 [Ramlibacter sp. XY19]|uniref:hypothetical protein n=1 Tax=Ramlibacter paludis TaxID=2908000 RepID=UPI0023DB9F4C|nr:hypothetical protein [Ramlibacter paludis]MCG2593928.1 hypothetical protein [Ramlibacter paludis]